MYIHVLKDEFKYTHQLKLLTSDKFNVINSSNKATAGQLIIETIIIFYRFFSDIVLLLFSLLFLKCYFSENTIHRSLVIELYSTLSINYINSLCFALHYSIENRPRYI